MDDGRMNDGSYDANEVSSDGDYDPNEEVTRPHTVRSHRCFVGAA